MCPRQAKPNPIPRLRRRPEEARRLILDAAEKRLREGGPEAIRLQDIARDVGISHPTILHHFESRDGLTDALQRRAIEGLEAEILTTLASASAHESAAEDIIERVFATLGDDGHARLLAWRVLVFGAAYEKDRESFLRQLCDRVHARRSEGREQAGFAPVPREDSEFVVRLTAAAMLGDGIFGPFFDAQLGHADEPDFQRRFRTWLARLLLDHLQREGTPSSEPTSRS